MLTFLYSGSADPIDGRKALIVYVAQIELKRAKDRQYSNKVLYSAFIVNSAIIQSIIPGLNQLSVPSPSGSANSVYASLPLYDFSAETMGIERVGALGLSEAPSV